MAGLNFQCRIIKGGATAEFVLDGARDAHKAVFKHLTRNTKPRSRRHSAGRSTGINRMANVCAESTIR
jgi:hypothetical protein